MSDNIWYEIHMEIDGHVTGRSTEEEAEKRARELTEATGQRTEVKRVERW
jgi:hypothetical protein